MSREPIRIANSANLFVELVLQAHEPEHLAGVFVERDESHFVAVVEVAELVHLIRAELADVREKPKSEILGADAGQKVPIQGDVFRPRPADQYVLAAENGLMHFPRAKLSVVRHRHPFSLPSIYAN